MERQLIFIGNVVLKKQAQPNPCGFIREMNMVNKMGFAPIYSILLDKSKPPECNISIP
jgi:hypothetical protein